MRRWVVAAVLGVALLGCVLLPLGTRDAVPDSGHRLSILHDRGDVTVSVAGEVTVRDTLEVDVLGNREYVFYYSIDRDDPADPRVRRDVTGLRVTRDGDPVAVVANATSSGRFYTVRIGARAGKHLSQGIHTYALSYRMSRVLEAGTTFPSRLAWLVVPGTFLEPVESVEVTVHLPARAPAATCSVTRGGACEVAGQGTGDLTVHAEHVPRLASVRLDAGIDLPPPAGPERLPWSTRMAEVLGPSIPGLVVVLALTLLAALAGLFLARGAYERALPPSDDVEPPVDAGPAAAAYVAHERLDHKAFVATLFWAAQRQMVRLTEDGNRWRVTGLLGEDDPRADSDVAVALTAFLGGSRGAFTARRGDAAIWPELHRRLRDMEDATRDWCVRAGYVRRTGPGRGWSAVLIGVATFTAFFAALTQLAGRSTSGPVPAAFALGALPLLGDGAATRQTRRGRELAARLDGLRRTVTSPLAAGAGSASHEDLYVAFLPWAVVLGCLDPWTRRFREGTGIEPPAPDFLFTPAAAERSDAGAVILDFSRAFEARRGPDSP